MSPQTCGVKAFQYASWEMPSSELPVSIASSCVAQEDVDFARDRSVVSLARLAQGMDASEARQAASRGRYFGDDGSPRVGSDSTRQLTGAGPSKLKTGDVSPTQGRGHVEHSFVEAMSGGSQDGHLVIWGDDTDFRSNGSRSGLASDAGKTDVTWTRGVSRRTTKKIQYFEPVSGDHDLLSDAGSRWSFSSIGSSVSNKPSAPALGTTRSDIGLATRRLKDEDYITGWLQLQASRSLPPRPSRREDDQDTFTDTGSAPDTSMDTTSIATIQEYLSSGSTAASASHLLYKKSKSPAAELAEELLENAQIFGKLRVRNFDASDHDSNGTSVACLDAEDDTYEYASIVERLRQAEMGLITPQPVAREVRSAAKHSELARKALSEAGAIPPLLRLLMPDHEMGTRHTAALALLNLAIGSTRNKMAIYEEGGVPMLIDLLRPESSISLRESATAVMLSLAASDHLKPHLENAIPLLVDILKNGTTQGRSDACRALLNLSIFKPNRPKIILAGAIPPLYMLVQRDSMETADKGVLLLGHLYSTPEGREAIASAPETFSLLLQILKVGSSGSKEQAAGILLSLCSEPGFRQKTIGAQGVLPSLVEMALVGSQKAQERASRLLEMLKNHRSLEGVALVESGTKPRRRRATSLSGVEELASKVKEAEVAAAVEVVASAIEEEASADDETWLRDETTSSSTLKASSTTQSLGEVPASSAANDTSTADLNQKQTKESSGSSKRRGTSFSGGLGSAQNSDQNSGGPDQRCKPRTPGRKKSSKDGRNEGPPKPERKGINILLSLRTLWTRRREAGCKSGLP